MIMRAVSLLFVALAVSRATAEPRFIGDIEDEKPRWANLIGISLEIEGRVSLVSRGKLHFSDSTLSVTLPETAQPKAGGNYVVRGEMRKGKFWPQFVAVSVRETQSDEDALRTRASRLDADDADGLIALADRFAKRAEFYDDADLRKQVRTLMRKGLAARVTAANDDPEMLATIAAEATERELADFATSVHHRVARLQWKDIASRLDDDPRKAAAELELLVDRMNRSLPGASIPLASRSKPLEAAYAEDPYRAFESADANQRLSLARMLYWEVVAGFFASQLTPNATNADAIAEELATRLPDRPDLAAAYRSKSVDAAMAAIDTMTEADLTALIKRLTDRGETDRVNEAIDSWLASRRAAAESRGPRALFEVAEDYVRLKGDEETAIELYIETLAIDSRIEGARAALEARGYTERAGVWRQTLPKPVAGSPPMTVTPGKVTVGMTDAQVRRVYRTAPDSVARVATFGEVTEVWVYRDLGQVITLARRGSTGEARVTNVVDLDQ